MKSEKLDVAVTSRAAESNALWMINHLRSQMYRDLLGRVTYLPIANSNQSEWRSEIQKHSFSILYHTRNHGRINLTDVTDSLYDLELQELSETLGRDNVMVVVDDLVKSDEEERQRILEHQPSLSRWASQLVLFSVSEKNPVPAHKQQVLLQTFRRGNRDPSNKEAGSPGDKPPDCPPHPTSTITHKKDQQQHNIWKVALAVAGCVAVGLLARKWYIKRRPL